MSNNSAQPTQARSGRFRVAVWSGIGVVVIIAVTFMIWRMNYVPADLDLSTTRLTENGLFKVSFKPQAEPIPVNQIHSWTLHVETADGRPVEKANITVDGDMPQHGHGLPTKPEVRTEIGGGDYLVEGMKFQMTGWWVVDFDIAEGFNADRVRFNLLLK